MYKRADRLALFSELFVYELGTALGFPMAYYERVDGSTIRSRDFTGGAGVNFEPVASIVGDDDDYGVSYAAFRKLGTEFSDAIWEIILLDAVCENDGQAYQQLWRAAGCGQRQNIVSRPELTTTTLRSCHADIRTGRIGLDCCRCC